MYEVCSSSLLREGASLMPRQQLQREELWLESSMGSACVVNATACGAPWSSTWKTVVAFGRLVGRLGVQSGSGARKATERCVSIPAVDFNLVSGLMVLSWGGHVRTQCPTVRLFVVLPSRRPVLCVLGFPGTALCALVTPGVFLDPLRLPHGSPFCPRVACPSARGHVHHLLVLQCSECERVAFLVFCTLSLPSPVLLWWLQATVAAPALLARHS